MSPHPKCDKKPDAPARARVPPPTLRRPRADWASRTGPAARLTPALAAAAAVLLVLASGVLAPALGPVDAGSPDAGVPAASEAPTLTDGATDWPGAVASLPIPTKPPPEQETRCDPKRDEVSISGGCYLRLERTPPCAEGQFVHEGRCYVAVGKRSRPAQSIGE